MALLALVLAAALPSFAASPADLDGSWLGRLTCDTGSFRMTLRMDPRADGLRAFSYGLRELGGGGHRGGGTGVLSPDGTLSLARPAGVPLLPETVPGRMSFEKSKPKLSAWTELGALESLAGGKADCALKNKGKLLDCAVAWRLANSGGACRAKLLKQPEPKPR